MKKIIALLLALTCVFALFSCGEEEPDIESQVNSVIKMYEASAPTKISTVTVTKIGNITLNGTYTLVTGKIDGMIATVQQNTYEKLADIESGSTSTITSVIETVKESKEFVQDKGVRINGGTWNDGFNFAPVAGDIALGFTYKQLINPEYKDGVLTCKIAAGNTGVIFGEDNAIDSDVVITIVNDGASITGVTLSYTIPEDDEYPAQEVTITTTYTYDLEEVTLVK